MKTNIEKAKEYGILIARGIYKDFTEHPEYCGSNWKWKNFPSFVYKYAKSNIFIYFKPGVRNLDVLERMGSCSAEKEAIRLMKKR